MRFLPVGELVFDNDFALALGDEIDHIFKLGIVPVVILLAKD